MDELLSRLESWLATHRPAALAGLRPGASPAALAGFTGELGIAAPPDLLALLAWREGQDEEAPAFQYNRELLSIAEILEERSILAEALEEGEVDQWDGGWIPFLRSWGGDLSCIDVAGTRGPAGEVFVRTSDDEVFDADYPDLRTWLRVFVETLEAGLWADDEGDLQPTNDDEIDRAIAAIAPGYPVGLAD